MNFQRFHSKKKNLKHFTRPRQLVTLGKLFRPPPNNIQTFGFQALSECISWVSRNDAVHMEMLFLKPTRNMFARKFVK